MASRMTLKREIQPLTRPEITHLLAVAKEHLCSSRRIRRSEATGHEDITSNMGLWSVGGRHGECLLAGAGDAEHGKALRPGVYPFLRVRFRHRSVAAQLSTFSSRLFLARLFRRACDSHSCGPHKAAASSRPCPSAGDAGRLVAGGSYLVSF